MLRCMAVSGGLRSAGLNTAWSDRIAVRPHLRRPFGGSAANRRDFATMVWEFFAAASVSSRAAKPRHSDPAPPTAERNRTVAAAA